MISYETYGKIKDLHEREGLRIHRGHLAAEAALSAAQIRSPCELTRPL